MTEYISNNNLPTTDAVIVNGGELYNWMRILAGGGTSEFSAIRMRGPLTLEDGSTVAPPKYSTALQMIQEPSDTYTFPAGPLTWLTIGNAGGTWEAFSPSLLLISESLAPPRHPGFRVVSTLVGSTWVKVDFSFIINQTSVGTGEASIKVIFGGVPSNWYVPKVGTAFNVPVCISGSVFGQVVAGNDINIQLGGIATEYQIYALSLSASEVFGP